MRLCLSFALLLPALAACPAPPDDKPPPAGRTRFSFAPIDVEGVTPRWGSASVGPFLIGGVDGSFAVKPEVFSLDASDGTVRATALPDLAVPRYCNCALFDESRHELVVVGGRDGGFNDAKSAEIIDTDTGEHSDIDANGAADHPVGCHAFFSKKNDRGYIFGGLDSSSGWGSTTFRYDPSTHTITPLDVSGPVARYDAGIHELDDGDVLLVGGMGGSPVSVSFFSDLWRFHAADETWEQIAVTGETPPGRRYPWTALSPDEKTLLYGFGSDSGTGSHMLGDLWVFHFDLGQWFHQHVEGELPSARGFTYKWQGPPGTAGVLGFGSDDHNNVLEDAYVLEVPDDEAGRWH